MAKQRLKNKQQLIDGRARVSSGAAHLGASTSWGKIPILWGVTINNASAWMWGMQLKGIYLSQMPVNTFIPGTRGAAVDGCVRAWVCVDRQNAVFTLFPSCVIYFTPWCFHLTAASEEIRMNKAKTHTRLLSLLRNSLWFPSHLNLNASDICICWAPTWYKQAK